MRILSDFLIDDTGAVTIEFTTLVPAFVLILIFFIDVSMVYLTRSEMYNVARDAARRMATGQFTEAGQVRDYVETQLGLGDRTYRMFTHFGGEKRVTIAIRIGDAAIFGHWFHTLVTSESIARDLIWARAEVRGEPLNIDLPGGNGV